MFALLVLLGGCNSASTSTSTASASVPESVALQAANPEPVSELSSNPPSSNPSANLTDDALLAPPAPQLRITASPGQLELSWDSPDNIDTVNLYEFDTDTGIESLLPANIYPSDNSYSLQIAAHKLRWNQQQYRVELCDAQDCVSSLRTAVQGLAVNSLSTLQAGVFLQGERFAESVTLAADGRIAAIAEPLAETVSIYMRQDTTWILTGKLSIASNISSDQQALKLAFSSSSDSLAVLQLNLDNQAATASSSPSMQLHVFERLGENWLRTSLLTPELSVNKLLLAGEQAIEHTAVEIADDADLVVISVPGTSALQPGNSTIGAAATAVNIYPGNTVMVFERNSIDWFESARFEHSNQTMASETMADAVSSGTLLPAMALSNDGNRLFLFSSSIDGPILHAMQKLTTGWQLTDWMNLPQLIASSDLQLVSSGDGQSVSVLGWSQDSNAANTPVLWRYGVAEFPADPLTACFQWIAIMVLHCWIQLVWHPPVQLHDYALPAMMLWMWLSLAGNPTAMRRLLHFTIRSTAGKVHWNCQRPSAAQPNHASPATCYRSQWQRGDDIHTVRTIFPAYR